MPVLKQTATCFTPPCMCRYSCIFSEFILREISNGLSFYVLERENRKAPNQHRLSSAFSGEPPNTAPPPFSLWRFYIHSKTACRGFKSFCPCQKSQVSLVRYLTFSLVCGRIWQRGAPAGLPAVRVVGACSPVGCVQARPRRQPRQVLLPLPKTGGNTVFLPVFFFYVLYGRGVHAGSDSGLSLPFAPVPNRFQPLQHPKRTRFCLFQAFSGAFLCFPPFWTCKILGPVFVHPVA